MFEIFIMYGLVNGMVVCVDVFFKSGDGIVLMIFVYYVFVCVIMVVGCEVVECELVNNNGCYEMDFDVWDV